MKKIYALFIITVLGTGILPAQENEDRNSAAQANNQ
jgi:hypothetical protein